MVIEIQRTCEVAYLFALREYVLAHYSTGSDEVRDHATEEAETHIVASLSHLLTRHPADAIDVVLAGVEFVMRYGHTFGVELARVINEEHGNPTPPALEEHKAAMITSMEELIAEYSHPA